MNDRVTPRPPLRALLVALAASAACVAHVRPVATGAERRATDAATLVLTDGVALVALDGDPIPAPTGPEAAALSRGGALWEVRPGSRELTARGPDSPAGGVGLAGLPTLRWEAVAGRAYQVRVGEGGALHVADVTAELDEARAALASAVGGRPGWSPALVEWVAAQKVGCAGSVGDRGSCAGFVPRAVARIHGRSELLDDAGAPRAANDLAAWLRDPVHGWRALGLASSQEALRAALDAANAGLPAIAVRVDEPYGHAVLVLPGELVRSGSWDLEVPSSVSLFRFRPALSYVGKHLGYAWSSPAGVELFAPRERP